LLPGSFWLRKITTDPHILAYVKIECPDDRYPKLKICISELILDSYEYILVACLIIEKAEVLVVAAKETKLEVNADKTKYMVMSRDQNAGRNQHED
jgi:hypothetical protein